MAPHTKLWGVALCGLMLLSQSSEARRSGGGKKKGHERSAKSDSKSGSGKKDRKAAEAAEKLLTDGKAALASKDLTTAQSLFSQAFRLSPSPEALFQLGAVALAEGHTAAAQDLMRRFVQEVGADSDDPNLKEAQRVGTLPAEPTGEVNVLGARGALVLVDDKLLGALPLALPLQLTPGTHKIAVELGSQRAVDTVKSLPGQLGEVRVNLSTGVVVVSLPPALVMLVEGNVSPEQRRTLTGSVTQALAQLSTGSGSAATKDRYTLVQQEQALAMAPKLTGCLNTAACQTELGNQNEAPYVLTVRATPTVKAGAPVPPRGPWSLQLEVLDPSVGEVAASAQPACADCSAEQAMKTAGQAVGPLLTQATGRTRGTVEVNSEPTGAEVIIDGKVVGRTPYRATRWAGSYPVKVQLPGRPPFESVLKVQAGEPLQLTAQLPSESKPDEKPIVKPAAKPDGTSKPAEFAMVRKPRPTWRIATGAVLLGGGAVMSLFGGSALFMNGRCDLDPDVDSAPCDNRYQTLGIGSLLTGVGVGMAIGGVIMLAVPGPLERVQVAVTPTPGGLGLWVGGRF